MFHVGIARSRRETVVAAETGNESPFISEALGKSNLGSALPDPGATATTRETSQWS